MNALENAIWQAAEYLGEWTADCLTYKLYSVPREAIDEDSDDPDAHLLHGLDNGNVRRVDVTLDTAYGRTIDHDLSAVISTAPEWAVEILRDYA